MYSIYNWQVKVEVVQSRVFASTARTRIKPTITRGAGHTEWNYRQMPTTPCMRTHLYDLSKEIQSSLQCIHPCYCDPCENGGKGMYQKTTRNPTLPQQLSNIKHTNPIDPRFPQMPPKLKRKFLMSKPKISQNYPLLKNSLTKIIKIFC